MGTRSIPETDEIDACLVRNLVACARSFEPIPGAMLRDDGRVVMAHVPLPLSFYNVVAEARLGEDSLAADVDEVLAPYERSGAPWRWWLAPGGAQAALEAALAARGGHGLRPSPGMGTRLDASELAPAAIPGFEIVPVRDGATLDDWVRVFCAGFGIAPELAPHWRAACRALALAVEHPVWSLFVGYLGGEAVATSALLMDGTTAGIYHVLSDERVRGRGVGAEITRAAMRDGHDRGADLAVLHASVLGEPVYARIGYRRASLVHMRYPAPQA